MESPAVQPSETPLLDSGLNIRHYLHILLERRWLAISAFLVVVILTGVYLLRAPKIYSASARVQINRESGNILNVKDVMMEGRGEMDYLQTQYKNLQNRSLIATVVKKLSLEKDPRYAQAADTVSAVLGDVSIAPIRLSRLVDVRVQHTDPEKAAKIANTIAMTFVENNLNQKMEASIEAVEWLKTQVSITKDSVKAAEAALHSYQTNYNEVSLEEGENIVRAGLMQAKAEWSKASIEAAKSAELVSEIDALLKSGKSLDTIPQIAENPTIQKLKQELSLKEASLASLLKRYRDKYPSVIQARAEIANLRESIQKSCQSTLESLRNDAQIKAKSEQVAKSMVANEEKKQLQLNQLRIQYNLLKREASNNQLIADNVAVRMRETELMSKLDSNNMLLVDPAVAPLRPIKPHILLTIALGIVGGFATALALAFFVSYLDDSIKSQDDVETYLRLPFLGYVPNIKTNSVVERDLQAHLHPQSNAAEGFRTIRATISLTPRASSYRVISISSTIPSEGKSLVASNLAIVNAQTGLKTLLVDADLRRPSVHKAFQLHSPIGLSSFLTKEVESLDELIHTTEVPNLDVVCCGAVPGTPSELVGSPRMQQFLQTVRGRYDRVVLDCPPISAVSDPLVIASMSDGIVFVTKFNKIRREHARKSVQRLQNAGIHIMGVVINDIDFEGKDSYYYSYYYYQNRYYSSHYKTKKDGETVEKTEKA
ncbi:MAG: polysaccharide biosynthesis tyrosine autokinase [Verrucomicrobiota bacterium]|nr:polysaccharide biosynthesis tyrosine autokinase [Verrucomicrobiota bacterium]